MSSWRDAWSRPSRSPRRRHQGYMRRVPPACHGTRLKPEILAVTLSGPGGQDRSIADISRMSVADCAAFLDGLELNPRQAMIAGRVLKEIQARMGFLLDVGLDYLSLDRVAGSLSGGEAQRIRLATQIGSGLAGVLLRPRRAVDRSAPAGQTVASSTPWSGSGTWATHCWWWSTTRKLSRAPTGSSTSVRSQASTEGGSSTPGTTTGCWPTRTR